MKKGVMQKIIRFLCLRFIVIGGEEYTWMAAINHWVLAPVGVYVRFNHDKSEYELKRKKQEE